MNDSAIFIVDDDPGHAFLVRTNLEESGLQNPVRMFESGDELLDFMSSDASPEPLLILLDVNMPGLRGTEVLQRLKTDAQKRMIPVIMLTTSCQEAEVQECYELGCNLYVTKPVNGEKFADAIQALGLTLQNAKWPNVAS